MLKNMSSSEIRKSFIKYFEDKQHIRVPSSSLIPYGDQTLLFTNAGMVQFKDVFLGIKNLPYKRAVSAQKCVRAGGKHNDLENVGRTARHHTFFEMLGNFSFGDYFKREAILYAWEYLTEVLELPKDKLYVTIYIDDDEAFRLWREVTGIPPSRIIRLGEEDNFWSMGETGPCGPCSEIYIDRGEERSCGASECGIGKCDCDRWCELWNLVFMQYDRDENGNLKPLPKPSIDTGMGLERVSSVMQGVDSNFDTDLLRPIISNIEEKAGQKYYADDRGFPFRVISDHIRACTFLIGDGVVPSNEGRGYVLRRIMRRAIRYCKVLGFEKTILHELVPVVTSIMGKTYPNIKDMQEYIQKAVHSEEEKFIETLNEGMKIVNEIILNLKSKDELIIKGEDAFKLYDTYGFPLDLTEDIANENGLKVDKTGFDQAMEKQREKARLARVDNTKGALPIHVIEQIEELPSATFTGYNTLSDTGEIIAIINKNELVDLFSGKDEVIILLDRTPFFAESGGQVGDIGYMENSKSLVRVTDTISLYGKPAHICKLEKGLLNIGDKLNLHVNKGVRYSIARNHTATHLLHKALREVLGEQVKQSGSFVGSNRLRFDFNHFAQLSNEEIEKIEDIVNTKILENIPIEVKKASVQEALKQGAIALFGEKYGEEVRVVSINKYSKELCGGTHLNNTGEIGLFKIISESSIGAGLRRIEAITGLAIIDQYKNMEKRINEISEILNVNPKDIISRINELEENIKIKGKELSSLQNKLSNIIADKLIINATGVNNSLIICSKVDALNIEELRNMADVAKGKVKSAIIILGAIIGKRINFVVKVTDDLVERKVHAGQIAKEVARAVGGNGGGRADMAQAGGKELSNIDQALEIGEKVVKSMLV